MKIYKNVAHLKHHSRLELVPGKFIPTLDIRERTGAILETMQRAGDRLRAGNDAGPALHPFAGLSGFLERGLERLVNGVQSGSGRRGFRVAASQPAWALLLKSSWRTSLAYSCLSAITPKVCH
ncbi:hypothetical protein [Pseudomonas sp. S1_E04]